MKIEQMKLIQRALIHIASEEQKQDKTNLARRKQKAHRRVCFVCFAFFKSRALRTGALRGALSTRTSLKAFDFNKTIYT